MAAPVVVQSQGIGNSLAPAFSSPVGAGHLMVVCYMVRSDTTGVRPPVGQGWTQVQSDANNNLGATPNSGTCDMFYKYASGGETTLGTWTRSSGNAVNGAVIEISGVSGAPVNSGRSDKQAASTTPTMSAITGDATKPSIAVAIICAATTSTGYTPGSGYTEMTDNSATGPTGETEYKADAVGVSSYTPANTSPANVPWCGVAAVFTGNLPLPSNIIITG